jgi:hypothetical protein
MRVFEVFCVMVALLVTAASGELLHSQDGVSQDVHAAHGGVSLAAAVQSNLAQGSLVQGSLVQNSNLHVAQDALMLATDTQSKQAQTAKGLISLRAASRGSSKWDDCFKNSGCKSWDSECQIDFLTDNMWASSSPDRKKIFCECYYTILNSGWDTFCTK